MNRLVLPASGSTLTGLLAISLWKRGVKDIALGFGLASATLAYFSIFDFLRGRDPEHKAQLYKKRKAAWEESNARPIIGILKQQAARMGGLAALRKPQMGQGLMMQFIQAGEQSLQRQDLATATKYFTYGVDVSYISQGPEAAQKLINTVGSMIPHIVGQIQADFAKDKKAIDRMIAEEEKPLKTRDDIIKSIKENQDLDVDPIDESDEEADEGPKQAIIEEVIEEDALDEEPLDDDEPVVQAAPVEPVQAVQEEVEEEVVAEEVAAPEEVVDEVKIEEEPEATQAPDDESEEEEEITSAEIVEVNEVLEAKNDEDDEVEAQVDNREEDEEQMAEPVNEEPVNADEIGDAPPTIVKTTFAATPAAEAEETNEIEDEELE